jgi:hypothetical protein
VSRWLGSLGETMGTLGWLVGETMGTLGWLEIALRFCSNCSRLRF